jgi:hypothetical protein
MVSEITRHIHTVAVGLSHRHPRWRLPALRRCSADRRRNKLVGSDVPVLGGEDGHMNDHSRNPSRSRTIRRTAEPAASQRVELDGRSRVLLLHPPQTHHSLHACTSTSLSTSHDINSLSVASSSVPHQCTPFSCACTPIYS